MRIGVTGSNGFIGSRLIKRLKSLNYTVIEIEKEEFKNINKLNIDILYHLGTNVPFADYKYDENCILDDIENIITIMNLKIKKVIYVSGQRISEHITPYGRCKLISEKLIIMLGTKKDYCILKFPPVYGPEQRPIGFIHDIAINRTKEKITKPFLYINDAIDILVEALTTKKQFIIITKGKTNIKDGIRKYKIYLNHPIYLDLDGTLIKTDRTYKFDEKEIHRKKDILFPFTIDLLEVLKEKHSLILLTKRKNRKLLIKQLKQLDIFKYFSEIINTSYKPKENFIEYNNAIIIGDTEDDIIAGQKNNLVTVAVTWGCRTKEQLKQYNPDIYFNFMENGR